MAIIMSRLIEATDLLVVAIPIMTFVTMLPGLLYFELAFDVQRSFLFELLLCLLPSSAMVLTLRMLCSVESIGGHHSNLSLFTQAPISKTPVLTYLFMLTFDIIIYTWFAIIINPDRKIKSYVKESKDKRKEKPFITHIMKLSLEKSCKNSKISKKNKILIYRNLKNQETKLL